MKKKYLYDAFISYRHTELDKLVAETIHKQMESFRLPRKLVKTRQTSRTRIERVFRDKDELPLACNLEEPIIEALKDSEFLIVICTPRIRESLWCKKEIETFISLHGRKNILAVLAEGEPEDSFPEELLYAEETVTNVDGTTKIVRKPVEPLAADVRGNTKKDVQKAIKVEILRLLAPIFSVTYDSLRQRHRERRIRKIMTAIISIGAACLAFGIYSTIMAMQIKKQSNRIEEQSGKINTQNVEIRKQNEEIKKQNAILLDNQVLSLVDLSKRQFEEGDRIGAIQTAYHALTNKDGIEMPFTSQAQLALTNSLLVYDIGIYAKAQYQIKTDSVIRDMACSQDKNIIAMKEASGILSVWDLKSNKKIATLKISDVSSLNKSYTFVGNDKIAYISDAGVVSIYSISMQKNLGNINNEYVMDITADSAGEYIAVHAYQEIVLYDGQTLNKLDSFTVSNGETMNSYFKFDEKYFYYAKSDNEGQFFYNNETEIIIYNLEERKEESSVKVPGSTLRTVIVNEGKVFVLYGRIKTTNYNTDLHVMAFDITSGELIWSYIKEDSPTMQMVLPGADGENLLIAANYQIILLSMGDGTEVMTFPISDEIIKCFSYSDNTNFFVFTKQGKVFLLYTDRMELLEAYNWFVCRSDNVKDFAQVSTGYVVLDNYANAITLYNMVIGPKVTASDENPDAYQFDNELIGENAIVVAKEKNLPNAMLADCLFYSDNGKYMFVGYANNNFEIYDTKTQEILSSFECTEGMYWYLGMDSKGNHYIKGHSGGYIINSEMEPIAYVENLYAYDSTHDKILLDYVSDLYESPVYTLEELLIFAKEYIP